MTSLKIDMRNPVLVCGPMKVHLINGRNRNVLVKKDSLLDTKPVECDDLIGYSKVIWS